MYLYFVKIYFIPLKEILCDAIKISCDIFTVGKNSNE